MAQIEKYHMMAAMAIIAHCERTCDTHRNSKIDPARTGHNYSLWPPDAPDQIAGRRAMPRLRNRLREVSMLNRKDVNVLCDWCIHAGADVPPGYANLREFFEACVRFVSQMYGPENIIFSWVHLDEDTPHIHIGFVPIVHKHLKLRKNASEATKKAYEEALDAGKTMIERVDADGLITRAHLQGWHRRFSDWMTAALGYDPGVYTGITEALGGNMTVKQLKKQGPDWAKERKEQADAFHAARRASREGERPALDDRITLAGPKPQEAKQSGLDAMIQNAKGRMGKRK